MGTYQKIYHYQRKILVAFYTLFCILMIYPIILLLQKMNVQFIALYIFIPLLFIILCTLAGSYLYVISVIPLKLVEAFDSIRNKIAAQEIKGIEQFANEINKFTTEFFNFRFFDIRHSIFVIKNIENTFLSADLSLSDVNNINELWKISQKQEEIYEIGYININNEKLYALLIPIWFGNEHLGMMTVYVKQKPGKFFMGLIRDYEELFIDDQLLHIINLNRNLTD
ncbi:MAG: hypothetical protein GX879_08395 [Bacteroidales bacterium]|nr:hypothetical protein [Bacteroidales bacterium]